VGQALLFFGVDRRDADFIYKEELLERRKQVPFGSSPCGCSVLASCVLIRLHALPLSP
jgi:hypothetical protein